MARPGAELPQLPPDAWAAPWPGQAVSANRDWYDEGRREGFRLGVAMAAGVIGGCALLGAIAWFLDMFLDMGWLA